MARGPHRRGSPGNVPGERQIQDPLQERQDEIRQFFFGVAVGFQDKVVITGIVAAYAGVTADVVLAGPVDVLDEGQGLLFRESLLPYHPRDAMRQRGGDEYVQSV